MTKSQLGKVLGPKYCEHRGPRKQSGLTKVDYYNDFVGNKRIKQKVLKLNVSASAK